MYLPTVGWGSAGTVVVSPPKLASRSASAASHNTLRVQPQSGVLALVHSLPDLTLDPSPPRHPPT
ncbi:hypothetical protein MSG28_000864 [Choristoneura fumiferana]|uniref:Uncharacterized protein n=1 Tax=Choristoneura fumiferana TaxID=7141 RepID=A0ACC0K2I7_CHOFU|nr:hypothetical protein MSG28_000864 [Choristoneura fumiferana]